jgi:hypothetical protein
LTDPPEGKPEQSPGFFEVSTRTGWDAFERHINGLTSYGGGDAPEQPFEGIHVALEMFLRNHGKSFHTPGAAPVIVLFGDAGNHRKGHGKTRFDREDVLRSLQPLGRDKRQVARVMFNPDPVVQEQGAENLEGVYLPEGFLRRLAAWLPGDRTGACCARPAKASRWWRTTNC